MFPVCKASPKSEKEWDEAFDILQKKFHTLDFSKKLNANAKICLRKKLRKNHFEKSKKALK